MYKRVMSKWIITAALLGFSLCANAADNGIYLGASIGRANIKDREGALRFDGNDTGYKAIAGIRPLNWLAVEANYVDFGHPDDHVADVPVDAKGHGVSAYALGFFVLGPFDLFAKAGAINWDARISTRGLNISNKENGTDFAYGAGAQFRLGSLSFRGEFEKFNVNIDDLNMFSLGVTWTFL